MKVAPDVAARAIIAKFGGSTNLARALSSLSEEPVPRSTVQSWQNAGIPRKWQNPVLEAANRAAVGIGPSAFFEIEEAAE